MNFKYRALYDLYFYEVTIYDSRLSNIRENSIFDAKRNKDGHHSDIIVTVCSDR